ncbi:Nucleoplasmin-like protein ANO39 [Oopsacas minuta]|uniref:Nucleoplasmin-like protein ANO39 n=1 Tax=Oopsacas minuta TaxID=111878 RepID=A0AAV7JGB9_9METZ|nr:Nucleoplasmin-like protein ANO39 [Oopsacas minuta]
MAEFFGPPNEKPWGIVLDKNNNSVVWPSELSDGDDMRLELSQATLGAGAKSGERNIVELKIISEENLEETQSFPVVSLREGLSEHTLLNLTLNPPVSFKLVAGSGPISIMGVQHNVGGDETSESDSDDDDGDQLVKAESTTSSKKRKRESPVSEAKKSKVEAEKTTPVIAKKDKIDTKQDAKDKIMKMMGGEDSGDDSNDEMDEFTPSDSDDDDEGKNGLDLDDYSLSDESVEKVTKPSPVKKDKTQKATKPKPAAKQVDTKPQAKIGKVNPEAMEAIKAKIRANKSLPKTEDKFKNYIKSMRVSDAGQISELWKFVQQIRKP